MIEAVGRLQAPVLHAVPDLIERVFGEAMRGVSALSARATTTRDVAASKVVTVHRLFAPTVAPNAPGQAAVSAAVFKQNDKAIKAQPRHVDGVVMHSPSLTQAMVR